MTKTKLIVFLVLAVLAVIVTLQNTEVVETKVLFATVIMPRAFLLFMTLALGAVLGVLVTVMWSKGRKTE